MTLGNGTDSPARTNTATSVRTVIEQHQHLAGYHAHEWDRFTVRAPSFHDAATVAAALGWWLHCWTWEQAPGPVRVVDTLPDHKCSCLTESALDEVQPDAESAELRRSAGR